MQQSSPYMDLPLVTYPSVFRPEGSDAEVSAEQPGPPGADRS